tara:strand:- start:106 stop:765 length:660 start_codon:yes stop_codon:yes gene_type:complete
MKDFYNIFLKHYWIIFFLFFLWLVHFANIHYHLNLYKLGVFPRTLDGLWGIAFAPLVHSSSDNNHLINNSVPFLILTWAMFYFYRPIAWRVLFFSWIITGLSVWFFGRSSFHIGISGVIYSELFFLFFSGVFRRDSRLLTVALLVVFIYGSMIWGIFPYDWKISYESHLSGALVGVVLSRYYKDENATFLKKKTQWEIEEELGIETDDLDGVWKQNIED